MTNKEAIENVTSLRDCYVQCETRDALSKVLDALDKQNDLIEKYEKALGIAGRDFMRSGHCETCWLKDGCDKICDYKHKTLVGCNKYVMTRWKEKAGLE